MELPPRFALPAADGLGSGSNLAFAALVDGDDEVAGALVDRIRLAPVLGLEPLDDRARIDPRLGHEQRVADLGGLLFVRIGDGGADDFFHHPAGALLEELEHRDRVVDVAAADQVHDQPRLARGDAGETMTRLIRHFRYLCVPYLAPGHDPGLNWHADDFG